MFFRLTIIVILFVVGAFFWRCGTKNTRDTLFAFIAYVIAVILAVFSLPLPESYDIIKTPENYSIIMTPAPIATGPSVAASQGKPAPTPTPIHFAPFESSTAEGINHSDITEMLIVKQGIVVDGEQLVGGVFRTANAKDDFLGISYSSVGYFECPQFFSGESYVVFGVSGYSKITGRITLLEDNGTAANIAIKMYADDTLVATFLNYEKSEFPIRFTLALEGSKTFSIYATSQAVMFSDIEFIKY